MIEKCILEIINVDADGYAIGKIQNNFINDEILNIDYNSNNIIFDKGDLVSALIKRQKKKLKIIKILKKYNKSSFFYGVVLKKNTEYITIKKLPHKSKKYYFAINSMITDNLITHIKEGVLIKAQEDLLNTRNTKNYGKNKCKILNVFGKLDEFHLYPLIAVDEFNIDYKFSNDELKEAKKISQKDDRKNRVNLKNLPFITIDGEDAKDFDDAIYAEKINDKEWKIIVSIADVSFYIKENSILDKKAKLRGNSIYFPNMVIPMFPEEISNNLCSLRENEKKLCLSVEIKITNDGKKISHKFYKSIIKPKKRFTYQQIEELINSNFSNKTNHNKKLLTSIKHLYHVYKILKKQSIQRGCLNLKISDKIFLFDNTHTSLEVKEIESSESHQLIEEFMILANVCAAEEISKVDNENVYRVHEKPSPEKINDLIKFIGSPYDKMLKNKISTTTFNYIIKKLEKEKGVQSVNQIILRSQSQAKYNNFNKGHFGLALKNYVHFTSPIRRYSDLLIHRKLNQIINDFSQNNNNSKDNLKSICDHISKTERIAVQAERKTSDRMISYIYSKKINEKFTGCIISTKKFGVFVSINNGLVEGLIQKKHLPKDIYIFNEKNETLKGINNGLVFRTGLMLLVSIRETDILNGNLSLNYLKLI